MRTEVTVVGGGGPAVQQGQLAVKLGIAAHDRVRAGGGHARLALAVGRSVVGAQSDPLVALLVVDVDEHLYDVLALGRESRLVRELAQYDAVGDVVVALRLDDHVVRERRFAVRDERALQTGVNGQLLGRDVLRQPLGHLLPEQGIGHVRVAGEDDVIAAHAGAVVQDGAAHAVALSDQPADALTEVQRAAQRLVSLRDALRHGAGPAHGQSAVAAREGGVCHDERERRVLAHDVIGKRLAEQGMRETLAQLFEPRAEISEHGERRELLALDDVFLVQYVLHLHRGFDGAYEAVYLLFVRGGQLQHSAARLFDVRPERDALSVQLAGVEGLGLIDGVLVDGAQGLPEIEIPRARTRSRQPVHAVVDVATLSVPAGEVPAGYEMLFVDVSFQPTHLCEDARAQSRDAAADDQYLFQDHCSLQRSRVLPTPLIFYDKYHKL